MCIRVYNDNSSASPDPVAFYPRRHSLQPVKGKEWYQATDIAEQYETKRFSRGGQLIDRRERRAVLEAIGPIEDAKILEIACGTGRFSAMLGEYGAQVVGIDISGPMLVQGQEKATRANVTDQVAFIRGDAARLPFPDDHFDAVFAMRFFHLAPTPERYLEEMKRVSKDVIFFDTFNSLSTRTVYNWLLPMGSRLYDASEVHELLASTGLTLDRVEHDFILPYGFYRVIPGALARPLRRVDKVLGRSGIGKRVASVSFWQARPT